jgi:hypothetical protein
MRKRCGKSMDRLADIAFEKGLTHAETSGSLHAYLTSLYFYNGTADNIRIYGDKVYIFCNQVLVTVLDLPNKYKNAVRKLMDRREHV